jgi:hypothetical protein
MVLRGGMIQGIGATRTVPVPSHPDIAYKAFPIGNRRTCADIIWSVSPKVPPIAMQPGQRTIR